jgi:hypothetical protein
MSCPHRDGKVVVVVIVVAAIALSYTFHFSALGGCSFYGLTNPKSSHQQTQREKTTKTISSRSKGRNQAKSINTMKYMSTAASFVAIMAIATTTTSTMVSAALATSNGLKGHHRDLIEIPSSSVVGRNLRRKAKGKKGGPKLFKNAKVESVVDVDEIESEVKSSDINDTAAAANYNEDNVKRLLTETKLTIGGISVSEDDPMTGAEILFIEDAFKVAYNEAGENWEAHSVLMVEDGDDDNSGNGDGMCKGNCGRSLLRGNKADVVTDDEGVGRHLYEAFDVYIYSDFRCHYCDPEDEDDTIFITHPPSAAPTMAPSGAPTQAPTVNLEEKLSSLSIEIVFCSMLRTSRYLRFRSATSCSFKTTSLN